MYRTKGSTADLPTWEAMREPSIVSGDGDSDTDEVDQIRATPIPSLIAHSERSVYKRKESDWKIESAPKRAKYEQPHNIRDNSSQGNQSTAKPHPASISRASGDSESDVAHNKQPSTSDRSTGASSSMLAPPLPSRVMRGVARKSCGSSRPLSKNQSVLTPRPPVPPADTTSSALKSTPFRVPSKGKDIPSSLDSTLFSKVSAKVAARSHLHRPPDPNDVLEISSESSDTPPSSLKGKHNISPWSPNQGKKNGMGNNSRPKKEVIDVLDSDEELEMQKSSSRPTRSPSSRVLPSPKRAPSSFRMRTQGKSGVTTSSVKPSVQGRGNSMSVTTGSLASPAASLSLGPGKRVPDRSSLSTSPTLSRFSRPGMNSTSSASSPVTDRALGRTSLSVGHSRKMAGISNASKEASVAPSVSDDDSVNMSDLHAALGIPLPSTTDKCKEDAQSIKKRLGKNARKSTGLNNFIRKPGVREEPRSTIKLTGASGCSSTFVIDLTGDSSDEEGEQRVSKSVSSKSGNLSTPPTASARAVVEPSPLLSPSSPKTGNSMFPATALSPPRETTLLTESNQPLLKDVTLPMESSPLKASEIAIPSDQVAPPSRTLPSPESTSLRTEQRRHSLSPDVEMSTNSPLLAGLPHESSSSSPPLQTETHQQDTTPPPSEPASESGSSTSSPSISKQPLPTDGENTTQVTSSSSEIHSETSLRIPLLQTGRSATPLAMCLSSEASGETQTQTSLQMVLPHPGSVTPSAMCLSSEADVAEKLLADDESDDDAMQEADESDAVVEERTSLMNEEQSVVRMWIDDEAERLSEGLTHSQSTIKAIRTSLMTASSDSGLETSSDPGLGLNSPISVPSTRRSSRLSLLSNTSEEADAHHIPSSRSTSPEDVSGFKIRCSTLGGFPAYRFESYRKDPKNFPKVNYASDLPSSIQDHINNQPEEVRMLGEVRGVFEAMILENTADDEREAPPIVIQNSVDDEPTPPWEFWYSNKMWHGDGVPDPDVKNLKGCDCRGACNPKNKACACAQRQCQAMGDDKATEFAYDKNGRLKFPGFPIFECNNTCWCGPECTNRVVQHGRKVQVVIRKTENKGWGVFNGAKKIPLGTFIGIYAGELLTDEDAHMRGLKYNKAGTTYLFDLDFHHLKEGAEDEWSIIYTVDAYHAGNFTRFLNHSCNPNCRLYPCYINEGDIQKPLLVVFSIRDIEPDAEICFNYQGIYPGEEDDEDESLPEEDSGEPKDKIYTQCLCGAKNCRGVMFK